MFFIKLNEFIEQNLLININNLVIYSDELNVFNNKILTIKFLLNLINQNYLEFLNINNFDLLKNWIFYWYCIFLVFYYYYYPEPPCKRQFIRIYGGWQSFLEAAHMWNKPVFLIYERIELYFYVNDDLEEYEEVFFLHDLFFEKFLVNKLSQPLVSCLTTSRNINKLFWNDFFYQKKQKLFYSDFFIIKINWLYFNYKKNEWIYIDYYNNQCYQCTKKLFYKNYPRKESYFPEYYRYTFISNLNIYSRFMLNFEQLKINDYILGDWLPDKPSIFYKWPIIYEGVPNYNYIFPDPIAPIKLMEDYSKRALLFRKRPFFFKYNNSLKKSEVKEKTLFRSNIISWGSYVYLKKNNINNFIINKFWNNYSFWVPDWLTYNILNKGIYVYSVSSLDINFFSINNRDFRGSLIKTTRIEPKRLDFFAKPFIKRHSSRHIPELINSWEYEELNKLAIDWFPFKSEYIKFKEEV